MGMRGRKGRGGRGGRGGGRGGRGGKGGKKKKNADKKYYGEALPIGDETFDEMAAAKRGVPKGAGDAFGAPSRKRAAPAAPIAWQKKLGNLGESSSSSDEDDELNGGHANSKRDRLLGLLGVSTRDDDDDDDDDEEDDEEEEEDAEGDEDSLDLENMNEEELEQAAARMGIDLGKVGADADGASGSADASGASGGEDDDNEDAASSSGSLTDAGGADHDYVEDGSGQSSSDSDSDENDMTADALNAEYDAHFGRVLPAAALEARPREDEAAAATVSIKAAPKQSKKKKKNKGKKKKKKKSNRGDDSDDSDDDSDDDALEEEEEADDAEQRPKRMEVRVFRRGVAAEASPAVVPGDSRVRGAVKTRLLDRWDAKYGVAGFSKEQALLLGQMHTYADVLYAARETSDAVRETQLVDTYALHVLNHVLKTRDRILKHNAQIKARGGDQGELGDDDVPTDQGFTRPKVCIVVPMRVACVRVVDALISLLPSSTAVENKRKFYNEFGMEAPNLKRKPLDHQLTFGGNSDDVFKVGISITRKTMKLYTEFYRADIVIASPLGLDLLMQDKKGKRKRGASDFLSSIEVLVVDWAQVHAMQNWERLETILKDLNTVPLNSHGTNFARVRPWYIDGHSRFYRQSIILAPFLTPDVRALAARHCANAFGFRLLAPPAHPGVLERVIASFKQTFVRVEPPSLADASDARFNYFVKRVLPELRGTMQTQTLIFVPSYYDYLRLRRYFNEEYIEYGPLMEHTSWSHVTRSRDAFRKKIIPFVMMTARFHFYKRIRVAGVQNIVFYGLPDDPRHYSEVLDYVEVGGQYSSLALFDRYDALALERVVGSERAERLLTANKATHLFAN